MITIHNHRDMQNAALKIRREGQRIGFVPTMGFLHEGHLSLIRMARQVSDAVVVSIFVNPIQFSPTEDLARYPRDIEKDSILCESEGTAILFLPEAGEMYASDHGVYVDETRLSTGLCGASRPGHFRGVATVVAKLFNIVQPHVAVFGQKDAQQARVIEQMVRDLNFPVEILVAPIVREPGGLAMSSRNTYLSPTEREQAQCLYASLCLAQKAFERGTADVQTLKKMMGDLIRRVPSANIEYIGMVDYQSLTPVERIEKKTLIALAVRIGGTRLIDNVIITPAADGSSP